MPRPDVREERENQILDAATKVFSKLGFQKSRMDDIVSESGLSKGTLYWYFKSKDDLIIAILDRLFERELTDLVTIQQTDLSAINKLNEVTRYVITDFIKWLKMVPITYEFLGLVFRRKPVQQAFKKYFRRYLVILKPIIIDGIRSGELKDIDPTDVAIAMSAIFEGTLLLWVYDPETVDVEKHINTGMQIVIDGITKIP